MPGTIEACRLCVTSDEEDAVATTIEEPKPVQRGSWR
jgi:hypothetical protein